MLAREILDGGNVKGGLLKAHLEWIGENLPGVTIDEICRHVSPATAVVLHRPVLPVSWYPFRAVVETDRAIAAASGRDGDALFRELGRYSARINLTTNYKVYTRSEPRAFFELAVRLHGRFQDFGRAEYERTGQTSCRLAMFEYPCFSPVFCLSGQGYYEQATALHGGQKPQVRETACQCRGGSACRFEVQWT